MTGTPVFQAWFLACRHWFYTQKPLTPSHMVTSPGAYREKDTSAKQFLTAAFSLRALNMALLLTSMIP